MATDIAPTTLSVTVTSTQSQPTTTATSARNTTEFLIRFPPFPEVPDDTRIVSFSDYEERGIKIQPGGEDNETEIDACGVPTIAMSSIHSTDWCKTETRRAKFNANGGPGRKKRKRKAGGGGTTGPTAMDWEDYWEEREASYRVRNTYEPLVNLHLIADLVVDHVTSHLPAYDLLCQGAADFKTLRPWPMASKQSGPVFVWGEVCHIPDLICTISVTSFFVSVPSFCRNSDESRLGHWGEG